MTTPAIKSILVTTDLSPEASKAYAYARFLAERLGASIRLVTFLDTSIQMGFGGPFDAPVIYMPEAIADIKKRAAADLEAHAKEHFTGATVTTDVRESALPVHYAIADYITTEGIDLVVMASHGRSGIARTVLGSVAEQVLRRSSKPVVVVPVREK